MDAAWHEKRRDGEERNGMLVPIENHFYPCGAPGVKWPMQCSGALNTDIRTQCPVPCNLHLLS